MHPLLHRGNHAAPSLVAKALSKAVVQAPTPTRGSLSPSLHFELVQDEIGPRQRPRLPWLLGVCLAGPGAVSKPPYLMTQRCRPLVIPSRQSSSTNSHKDPGPEVILPMMRDISLVTSLESPSPQATHRTLYPLECFTPPPHQEQVFGRDSHMQATLHRPVSTIQRKQKEREGRKAPVSSRPGMPTADAPMFTVRTNILLCPFFAAGAIEVLDLLGPRRSAPSADTPRRPEVGNYREA
ncbi:hypothetical protein V8C35DRAFT_208002 [Trichoderma chlorosporum]